MDLTFEISSNIFSFGVLTAGPNGAGKTTTISMLTGLIPASNGDAMIASKDLHHQLHDIFENIGGKPITKNQRIFNHLSLLCNLFLF